MQAGRFCHFHCAGVALAISPDWMMNRAIFLDRDGTIIEDRNYLRRVEDVVVFPGAAAALGRLHRALWVNHRYWFTTWRWGKVLASMRVIGAVLKLSMSA